MPASGCATGATALVKGVAHHHNGSNFNGLARGRLAGSREHEPVPSPFCSVPTDHATASRKLIAHKALADMAAEAPR